MFLVNFFFIYSLQNHLNIRNNNDRLIKEEIMKKKILLNQVAVRASTL